MGYRIEYESGRIIRKEVRRRKKTGKAAAAVLVCTLVLGAISLKQTWLPFVQDYLIPGDNAVTAAAFEKLTRDLKAGEPFVDALEAFCNEIMDHAQSAD